MALMITVASIAVPVTSAFLTRQRADSGLVSALAAIQGARNRSVAERRNMLVTFVPPNRITVERIEVPGPGTTLVENVMLDNALTFFRFPTLPDTPDAFAVGAGAVVFTGAEPVMFTSDGSLVDADGDVTNGTIFFGSNNDPASARAVSIFGITGYLRTWKWGGAQWVQ